ncbi:hypothetical protein [Thalassotalea piscium]|uniref:Uncharacterized protein n=1 Tax=Thalassotalea piscium TaxID=1230533 RepID=A0A7X0TUX9_9GAMM|nr:hypothetical protein [Thalassotalea piscium]MBB6544756.1 hypothetical protein [Thalassotalea piscium]
MNTSEQIKKLIALRDTKSGHESNMIQREIDVLWDKHRAETQKEREAHDAEISHNNAQVWASFG